MQKAALLMYAIYIFKSTNLYIMVSGILIERECFEMFELLRIWSISQYLAASFSHCKPWLTASSTIVALISSDMRLCPWPLLPLPLFCLSVPFHHASLLLFLLSSVDPDCFLDVHPLSEFVTLVLSSVYKCFPIEGSWDAPLSYFRELVYMGWSIFSSLVKVKIHLHSSWQIYKKSNRNV